MEDRKIDDNTQFEVHRCAVCNGFGTLKYGSIKCNACGGTGFIVIDKMTGLPVKERQKDEEEEKGLD